MIDWIAFVQDAESGEHEKLYSKDMEFSAIPQERILGFSVIGKHCSMYVNLTTGIIAANGQPIKIEEIENFREKEYQRLALNREKFKLKYFKRGYIQFNPLTDDKPTEGLEYVACGWETDSHRVLMKMHMPDENIEIEFKELGQ